MLLVAFNLSLSVDFGRFAIKLDFLDSAVLEHSQVGRGCRFATSCKWPDLFCKQDLQIGLWPVCGDLTSALGCFQPQGLQCGLGLICNVATLSGDNKLETCSVSAAWAGAVLERQGAGAADCNILQWPDLFCTKTCSWNPVQIGVAGQPLASDLGWFDQLLVALL